MLKLVLEAASKALSVAAIWLADTVLYAPTRSTRVVVVTPIIAPAVTRTGVPTLAPPTAAIGSAAPYPAAHIGNVFNRACFVDHGCKPDRNVRRHSLGARNHEKPSQQYDSENKTSHNQPMHIELLFYIEGTLILTG